jgi:calcineurin-like phosphoesterase family protein
MIEQWFTSDQHFSHGLMKASRGFATLKEHDEALIERWNGRVKERDLVYCLGDFSFGSKGYTIEIIKQLHGQIHLILGNHDRMNEELKAYFVWVKDVYELKVVDYDTRFPWLKKKVRIWMSHYAHRTWPASHFGTFHLFAHSHGKLKDDPNSLSIDVGVDAHNLMPISYDEVKDFMAKKTWKPYLKEDRK